MAGDGTTWDAEAVLAASSEWAWIPPGAPHVRTDEVLVVAYPDHFDRPTGAWVFASDRDAAELVDEVHAIARAFGRDRLWWTVSDTSRPETLEPELRRRGGVVVERMDVLALPMDVHLPDLGVPAAIEVRRVRDLSTKRDAHLVERDAFGSRELTDAQLSKDLADLAPGFEDDSTGQVVAYLDGRPAGVGGWLMAGGGVSPLGRRERVDAARSRRLPGRARRATAHHPGGQSHAGAHPRPGGDLVADPAPDRPHPPWRATATCRRPVSERVSLEWDERGGVTVHLDGSPQSHIQPDDPTLLVFEYVQHLALAIDACPPAPPARLAVTHVGGAGLTLPRYLEATRPGSPQIVLEPDAALTDLVRREIPLPRRHRIRVRPQDGVTGVRALVADSADVLVTDAYASGRVPAELSSAAYVGEVARVLRPSGLALWNLADEPGLRYVARVLATVRLTLPHVVLIGTHEVLKGKRFGNAVLVASATALPVERLRRDVARANLPTGLREGAAVDRIIAGAKPFLEDLARSPEPPDASRWRVR